MVLYQRSGRIQEALTLIDDIISNLNNTEQTIRISFLMAKASVLLDLYISHHEKKTVILIHCISYSGYKIIMFHYYLSLVKRFQKNHFLLPYLFAFNIVIISFNLSIILKWQVLNLLRRWSPNYNHSFHLSLLSYLH